jgi:coiled-coil and C2 domain-containing protein 2A
LEKSGTRILVSLFDKEIYRHQEEGKIILQEENRFLGSFEIPLLTLLTSTGKIEFNFKINRPFCLPSYRVLAEQFFIISHNDFLLQDEQLRKNEQIPTYINMSVTLDPPICLPDENAQCDYKGYETEELLSHGTKYATDCRINPKLKGRKVSVFGENIDAESVLLCKYLTKVRPPDQLIDVDRPGQFDHHAIEKVARFVSLIPFIEDSRKFEDLTDMYCTPQEFLDIGEGDYEEHAILLCCYFKYIDSKRDDGLKVESYLVFGEAIPEGRTVYVLRK